MKLCLFYVCKSSVINKVESFNAFKKLEDSRVSYKPSLCSSCDDLLG